MSNKRGNDLSQQRREDYEADDTIVSEVPQGPFLKASEDEMKRRRIVHVSGGKYGTPGKPKPPIPGNPYAGVKLSTDTTINFNFGASAPAPTPVTVTTGDYDSKTKERLGNLEKAWQAHWNCWRHSKRDWVRDIHDHSEYKRRILAAATSTPKRLVVIEDDDAMDSLNPNPVSNATKPVVSFGSKTESTAAPPPAVVAKPSFSFGAPVPGATAGTAPSFSLGVVPPQASSSFGGSSFAFGSTAPSQASASPSSGGNGAPGVVVTEDDDAMPKEEPTKVAAIADPDWNEIYTFLSKYFKLVNQDWKQYCKAPVKVEVHKENGKKRMVMRDEVGKVQLNLSLAKGMEFKLLLKGKNAFIRFMAVQDSAVGMEQFMYLVKSSKSEEILAELNRLAA